MSRTRESRISVSESIVPYLVKRRLNRLLYHYFSGLRAAHSHGSNSKTSELTCLQRRAAELTGVPLINFNIKRSAAVRTDIPLDTNEGTGKPDYQVLAILSIWKESIHSITLWNGYGYLNSQFIQMNKEYLMSKMLISFQPQRGHTLQ